MRNSIRAFVVSLGVIGVVAAGGAAIGSGVHKVSAPAGLKVQSGPEEYVYEGENLPEDLMRYQLYREPVTKYLKDLPAGAKILDLGCGNGEFLSQFLGRGWNLTGVDFSLSGIEQARKRFPRIRFEVGDATKDLSSIGYGQYDAIISTDVIEHIFLPGDYAQNCMRMLKPGGVLLIMTPYQGYLKNIALAATDNCYKGSMRTPLWDYGHIKFWSVDTLSTLLFATGFEDVEWKGLGRTSYLWHTLFMKASKKTAP